MAKFQEAANEPTGAAGTRGLPRTGDAHRTRWIIVFLLLLSVCINYIDRGSLSVAAPVLSEEFSLSPKQLGYLLSAFFWSYTACQLFVGWLVDKYPVSWVYAAGFLLWSLAMAATGTVSSFWALFGARLLLGVGESVFLPSASRIMVQLFPSEKRGLPNALVDVGTKAGPALSMLVGGLFITRYGWRALFVGVGVGSLLWLLPWVLCMRRSGLASTCVTAASSLLKRAPGNVTGPTTNVEFDLNPVGCVSPRGASTVFHQAASGQISATVHRTVPTTSNLRGLLRRREVWGTSLGMFALGYIWVFLITWLPEYLVKQRGYTMKEMGAYGSLPYWGMAVSSLAGGWLSDVLIGLGASATLVRKTFAISGLLLCAALLLPAAVVSDSKIAMALLIGACVALGLFTSNVWAITQTLAGQTAAGTWTGIQNFVGNIGGIAAPIITGVIVQKTGSFFLAFAVATGVVVMGAVVYGFMVQKVEEVRYNK